MHAITWVGAVCALFGPTSDPVGDMYLPGQPAQAALGSHPDLISGGAILDATAGELRFEFTFAATVLPASDPDFEKQLLGFVDIDLDRPPVDERNSKKSGLSGFASDLGIEAFIDLSSATATSVVLSDDAGGFLSSVPITFDGPRVTMVIPLTDLAGVGTGGNGIAYAAYFMDVFQTTADVFPNGDGFLVSEAPAPSVPAVTGPGLLAAALLLSAMGMVCTERRQPAAEAAALKPPPARGW